MEDTPNSTSWFGDIYQKFEALGFENVAWQEGLKYVEGQVQTIGANVLQFFSEYEPQSSFVEDAVCDSPVTKSGDESNKKSNERFLEDFPDKDSCKKSNFPDTLSMEPYKVAEHDLPLEFHGDSCKDLATSVRYPSQAKQHGLELTDKITNENDDPNKKLWSPLANNLITSKISPPDVLSSNSAASANPCDTLALDVKLIDGDSSTGLMSWLALPALGRSSTVHTDNGKNVPVNEDSHSESSHKTKLDESCILVDGSDFVEFSSVSTEARRSKPHKYNFGAPFISKRRPRKQDCGSQSDSRGIQKKGVGEAVATASLTSTLNQEYYDSDWEIV